MKNILACILTLLLSCSAWAAASHDNSVTLYAAGDISQVAQDITFPGGCANPLLVAGVSWHNSATLTATATAGAMADSGAGSVESWADEQTGRFTQFFKLAGTTGTQTVTIDFDAPAGEIYLVLSAFCGVDQMTPTGTAVSGHDTYNTTLSIDVTAGTGGMVVDQFTLLYDSETFTEGLGQTPIENTNDGGNQVLASYQSCSGTCSMSWTYGTYGGYWGGIAMPINAAAATAPTTQRSVIVQ